VAVIRLAYSEGVRGVLDEARDSVRLQYELRQLLPRSERKELLSRITRVGRNVESPHNETHVLTFVVECLKRREVPGVLVEAGCYKGASTAKFSIAAAMLGKQLVVFDSFQGLPRNDEAHRESILGHSIEGWFDEGNFAGSLDEVRSAVETYGEIGVCEFVPGWFEETMPHFDRPVAAGYLDVDLASSTRTCLKHLYPLVPPGGALVSQDGDFPLVVAVFGDRAFWEQEVGTSMPVVEGLGERKMLVLERR
jgi:O-methyltransferase